MNRLLYVPLMSLVAVGIARAQDNRTSPGPADGNVAAEFAMTSAATAAPVSTASPLTPEISLWSPNAPRLPQVSLFAEPGVPAEPAAEPAPVPEPKFVFGSRDDFRWQLGLGVSLVRFRSSQFYATGVGTNTSITYFTNEWLGVEANINTSFAPTINNHHVKFASYGGGPKIGWRSRQWEPWAHFIAGGMHILPQTAGQGQNGIALQVGGGVDYRIFPHLSARLEADWVRTHVFGQWGNSAQANADIVLHF